ncbi:MAG: sodium:proton antiporter [Gemmatimonadetes bacterium]|jgi:Na+/H+ antiporter NhaD/arsenite permease-like protein|nr:sodium:proton antiporter [Gemmatimonadota bacterium]HCK10244.1 sodium:proton antiporter [Candidatus Latescibacterota bacterium]
MRRFALTIPLLLLLPGTAFAAGDGNGANLGEVLPLWSVIPFVGILLSIAIAPLINEHWWHHNFPKVSAAWAIIFAIPFLFAYGGAAVHEILHIYFLDYIPFIILLWGLFTAGGGIVIRGTLAGTPAVNTTLILIGTVLASWMGTTGASMVLIRPLLRANKNRKHKVHIVVFFIFLVSNIGGSLTPLGDPPLFLGFLHGVPFFWTMNLLPEMVAMSIALLAIFFVVDTMYMKKEVEGAAEPEGDKDPLKVEGLQNLIFLLGIMGAVLMSGIWQAGEVTVLGIHMTIQGILRDVTIVIMGLLSLKFTSQALREANEFNWFPIKEVGYLFAGIFMTIVPALAILKAGEQGALAFVVTAAKDEASYFWITGVLSSFLDNAPTYLTFFTSALGKLGLTESQIATALRMAEDQWDTIGADPAKLALFVSYLKAISVGAVFMGANTYIGNAPNFMVRSIAEQNGVKMPSFFGYMAYSGAILVPLFIVLTFVIF